jgi:hypothetical protein
MILTDGEIHIRFFFSLFATEEEAPQISMESSPRTHTAEIANVLTCDVSA